jgi:hypothetical protein
MSWVISAMKIQPTKRLKKTYLQCHCCRTVCWAVASDTMVLYICTAAYIWQPPWTLAISINLWSPYWLACPDCYSHLEACRYGRHLDKLICTSLWLVGHSLQSWNLQIPILLGTHDHVILLDNRTRTCSVAWKNQSRLGGLQVAAELAAV